MHRELAVDFAQTILEIAPAMFLPGLHKTFESGVDRSSSFARSWVRSPSLKSARPRVFCVVAHCNGIARATIHPPVGEDAATTAYWLPAPSRSKGECLAAIADGSAETLRAFIRTDIATGATVNTDGWRGYPGAPNITHAPHVIGPMAAHIILPWAHRLFANLKPTLNSGVKTGN